jgi:hypothetical protein
MGKERIDANIRCPSCGGQLYPRVLVCDSCGLRVEGDFVLNEFDALTPDELHFLRVFVQCEGRIRDMEAALGVSYPTVKARMADIKAKLALANPAVAPPSYTAKEVLSKLDRGEIGHAEAVRLLRAAARREKQGDKDE